MPQAATDTPMFRQYFEIKQQVPDALLFYRMGDFYELFFDDAKQAAELLELTLTSRNKNDPEPIPMCGVPHHAATGYLNRLVDAGRKVAIAEQVEEPGAGKKLLRRQLVRVVTPGMPLSPDSIEAREPCYLVAICGEAPVGLAFLDASTGDLRVTEVDDLAAAETEVARLEPREAVVQAGIALPRSLAGLVTTEVEEAWFDPDHAMRALTGLLGTHDLSGFGIRKPGIAVAAAGALVTYARDSALVDLAGVRDLRVYSTDGHMVLDEATRRNLEIVRPMRGTGRKGTLLHLLDRTRTPMGGRLLREWLSFPLTDIGEINERLDAVEALSSGAEREAIREGLRVVADLERLVGKAAQGTANARDLVALGASLTALPLIAEEIADVPVLERELPDDLAGDLADDIAHWLVDEPPASLTEGGLIRTQIHADLDELRTLAREGKGAIARLEAKEKEKTSIASLKVKHNKVFGYFIEVTHANRDRVPETWLRKQTLTNAERYITPELKEFEEKVLGADEKSKALEYELFAALRDRVGEQIGRIQALARAVARLDVLAALADVAVDLRYTRPVVEASRDLEIVGGRHPVVETMGTDERFVPNDCLLDEDRHLMILTGPNMAGKSTVMRQVALIALMAQIGSFVPASKARIGLCDRIFVRVGASDDLARGRSTFMVEMAETALILNQATSRSLVLLDEIGRGTSTYDGLAIAWAVAEAMHDRIRARTMFATHYHELVALSEDKERVVNQHIAVSEWGEQIIFLRTLKEGGASKSYGIQCARLAGMPPQVVTRARELLTELEKRPRYGPPTRQLNLFTPPEPEAEEPSPIDELLDGLDPDALSPREALGVLYKLKSLRSTPP